MEIDTEMDMDHKDRTIINVCIYEHNLEGDWYGVDPSLNHHYPFNGQLTYTIINNCICEYNSERDGYWVDPSLNHHLPLKCQNPIPS